MARAVTNSRHSEHNVKHVVYLLHWLPVEYRVHYKLAVNTFKVLTAEEPSYLFELNLSGFIPVYATLDLAAASIA